MSLVAGAGKGVLPEGHVPERCQYHVTVGVSERMLGRTRRSKPLSRRFKMGFLFWRPRLAQRYHGSNVLKLGNIAFIALRLMLIFTFSHVA